MRYEVEVDIDAAPEAVWAVLSDVVNWPEWTASMKHVQRLDEGAFGVGSRARVQQPGLPPTVYAVTEYVPGQAFTWAATAPGVTTIGEHQVVARADGRATVRLAIEQSGILAPLVGLVATKLIRRYVGMEAESLKRRCESASAP